MGRYRYMAGDAITYTVAWEALLRHGLALLTIPY